MSAAGRERYPRRAGILLGYAADAAFGDPQRWHPVSGFGWIARALERRLYAPTRLRGAVFTALLVGGATGAGYALDRVTRTHPLLSTAATAACTWTVLGGTTLAREAGGVADLLAGGDLLGARARVGRLVGRDPASMDGWDIARAAIESVAENTSDAVVAPLFWGAVAGPAGLLGYRAVNTLDAMVGHRSERYEHFGWAAARLDDLANLAPARLTAALAAVLAAGLGGDPVGALRAWRRDAHRHPSPNAGPVEAAFAGALGIRLGGVNTYRGAVEDRGTLGDGRAPDFRDIPRTVRLARAVGAASVVTASATATARCRPASSISAALNAVDAYRRPGRRGSVH